MAVQNPLANVIRYGWTPQGTTGSTPPPTGTDYRHIRPRLIYGLNHQYVIYGFQPVGANGDVVIPPTPPAATPEVYWPGTKLRKGKQAGLDRGLIESLRQQAEEAGRKVEADRAAKPKTLHGLDALAEWQRAHQEQQQRAAVIAQIEQESLAALELKRMNDEEAAILLLLLD